MPPDKLKPRSQNSLTAYRFLHLTSVQILGSFRLGRTCYLCLWRHTHRRWVVPHCLPPEHPTSRQRQNGLTLWSKMRTFSISCLVPFEGRNGLTSPTKKQVLLILPPQQESILNHSQVQSSDLYMTRRDACRVQEKKDWLDPK